MQPQFEDEDPVNPFDFWKGANFKIKIRNVEGYRNYDKSSFDSPSALGDDDELEEIWNKQHSLQEFLDPKHFKSYDELQARLMKVLQEDGSSRSVRAEEEELPWNEDETPKFKAAAAPKLPAKALDDEDEDDESLEFFKKLAAK